jgi:hypothetical protein
MYPILEILEDTSSESIKIRHIVEEVAERLEISTKSLELKNQSGEPTIHNRIKWAVSYLYQRGAIDRPERAKYSINDHGRELLEAGEEITVQILRGWARDPQKLLNTVKVNPPDVLSLGEELLFDPTDFFVEVEELLEDRPQAIFYGPPGTGKTWAALQIAEVLAGDESRTKLVQFHPSYAYEDFIEGWRPTEDGSFKITDGPLKRMASDAAANPNDTFVLVIDEINRANLSKVLGELFFLLEYRDRSITLQYSDTEFQLPENLKIIGTMNTADRSIALVDAALRRRFHFHGFFPDREPIEGLLRRWLEDKGKTDLLWVADLIDAANNKLDERDLAIGPSHFMKADLDEDKVQKIWKRSIMPYIEDHYFDDPDQATEFTYDQLRNNTQP